MGFILFWKPVSLARRLASLRFRDYYERNEQNDNIVENG